MRNLILTVLLPEVNHGKTGECRSKPTLAYKYRQNFWQSTFELCIHHQVLREEHFPPITTRRTLEIDLNMPDLRPSTLKQRAYTKSEKKRTRKHTARQKPAKSPRSSPSINHGLGTIGYLPLGIRQAIFEQFVPAEVPFDSDSFDIDEDIPVEDDPHRTTCSLTALLCTSKAIFTEVKRCYQNREYQLCLSASGIAFERILSVVSITCYCSNTWRTGTPRCNHCSTDLIWKVANSTRTKPLRHCDALKGLKITLPAIRRLHVTFTNDFKPESEWIRKIKHICSASGIWGIIRKAESAGVELRFTIDFPRPTLRPLDILFIREFFPAQYESMVTVKEPGRLMSATLFFPSSRLLQS